MIRKAKEKGVKKNDECKNPCNCRESYTLVNRSGVLFVMNIKKTVVLCQFSWLILLSFCVFIYKIYNFFSCVLIIKFFELRM